jgi:hypothetical protein
MGKKKGRRKGRKRILLLWQEKKIHRVMNRNIVVLLRIKLSIWIQELDQVKKDTLATLKLRT